MLLAGAAVSPLRVAATLVGTVAFLPQGVTRLVSFSIDEGQHDSYLRAGVAESILGLVLGFFLVRRLTSTDARIDRPKDLP